MADEFEALKRLGDYEDPSARVTRVLSGDEVEVFIGEAVVSQAQAIRVEESGELLGVTRHLGNQTVAARRLAERPMLMEDAPVSVSAHRVAFPPPVGNKLDLRGATGFVSEQTPGAIPYVIEPLDFAQIDSSPAHLVLHHEAIDRFAPLLRGGLNVVLDFSEAGEAGNRIYQRVCQELEPAGVGHIHIEAPGGPVLAKKQVADVVLPAAPHGSAFYMALRAAVSWCVQRRDAKAGGEQLFFARLPTLGGQASAWEERLAAKTGRETSFGEVISWLGTHLSSRKGAPVTALVVVRLAAMVEDLAPLLDTLSVGEVDALLVCDEEGRFDLVRSRSRLERDATLENRVRHALTESVRLQERAEIFGRDELEPEELEELEMAEHWQAKLAIGR